MYKETLIKYFGLNSPVSNREEISYVEFYATSNYISIRRKNLSEDFGEKVLSLKFDKDKPKKLELILESINFISNKC
ncbi:MAG: hypothetical protein AABW56_01955 [Nanoarchaeota archaeon]